ncbi:DNA-binding domain-containing protein [Sedimentitalea todarodis]|uniref:DNA-binding domain-containing protein n=1 Tax=Sedimentitalea todarodis TaxID=1631240 RepID=A0ABU3VF64_9RHOB|nr:DNA-binding domain-containing protein [Sedimentitalea todarodis]MDU9004804.1 DNA-binding domain-containing protein [Sedimentitalea todarodis]
MVPQALFREALLEPARSPPAGLSDGAGRPAGARFDVYRNNVVVSLIDALHTGFPVLSKLLGKENMDGLAGMFVRAHPPTSPVMMFYGEALPDFITTLPQLSHLGYLPDVARLELELRYAYHAADGIPISPDALAVLAPESLLGAQVALAPAVRVMRSAWPIHDIWRFNTQADAPKPMPGAQDVLITRADFDPTPHVLPAGGAAWIEALGQGQSIGAALETAVHEATEFDMTTPLTLLLAGNAILSLANKD